MHFQKNIALQQYQILWKYLHRQHENYANIEQQLRRLEAGHAGEERITYNVEQAQAASFCYIRNLRLKNEHFFQLDWLVLAQGFRVIFEVKAYTGTIFFDAKSHQLTREKEGKLEVFDDPLLQVDRQYIHLRNLLQKYDIAQLPTFRFAVFSNPNVVLQLQEYPEHDRIITPQRIPFILEDLAKRHAAVLSAEENEQLAQWLQEQHIERSVPILQKYGVEWEHVKKGIVCSVCGQTMKRERMRWRCIGCGQHSANAHKETLYELALLMENRLTKRMMQDFWQLESPEAARKLMNRAGLIKCGRGKKTYYRHPDLVDIMPE